MHACEEILSTIRGLVGCLGINIVEGAIAQKHPRLERFPTCLIL